MSNELTTQDTTLVNYNPGRATLLEMRADSARFPRLKTMQREQVVDGMTRIVSQAFLYRGQTADKTNIQFIASALADELLEDGNGGGNLSLAEIQVIVKRAVLDTDIYLSVSTIYKVITAFLKGEGRENQARVDNIRRSKKPYSPGMTMVTAATGEFIRNHKSK